MTRKTTILGTVVAISLLVMGVGNTAGDAVVVSDQSGIVITESELRYIQKGLPPNIKSQIRVDPTARFEVIASTLATKRILENLNNLDPTVDGDSYYRFQYALMSAAKEFDEIRFQAALELPDFEELAEERYRVSYQDIGVVPEKRRLSHVLLLCTEECDEAVKQKDIEDLLSRLKSGESFGDIASEFSQDPGSRQRAGRLNSPIAENDERIDASFRETAFTLSEVGEISGVVRSQFGFHIMRLDAIEPERHYTFEEVKAPLVKAVEERFREDAYRDYILEMGRGDDVVIDGTAVDAIFGTAEAPLEDS